LARFGAAAAIAGGFTGTTGVSGLAPGSRFVIGGRRIRRFCAKIVGQV
jgi:hypothetical protein